MYHRIMVPLDGSPIAEAAIAVALRLRADPASEILLVKMQGLGADLGFPMGFPVPTETLEAERLRCDTYLLKARARWTQALDSIRRKVLPHHEDISAELASAARSEKADLIVMTSHGWEGLDRTLRGSVTEELARMAPCPVLILGPQTPMVREAKEALRAGQ